MARTANVTRAGFMYHSTLGGAPAPVPVPKQVATTYATALYPGDVVKLVSDGSVAAAGAGDAFFGVVSHVIQYRNADGVLVRNGRYLPASLSYTADTERSLVAVIPAFPFVVFEVDADDGSTATTIAAHRLFVGENANLNATAYTADTGLGLSGMALDISTHAVTATLQWRIHDVLDQPGNEPAVTAFRYLVIGNYTGTQLAGSPALANIGVGI